MPVPAITMFTLKRFQFFCTSSSMIITFITKKKKKNLHISSFVKPTESNKAFEKMADLSINQLSYNIRTTELTGVITVL